MVARLRYSHKHQGWSLFWIDSNGAWHRYSTEAPVPHVSPLLEEIDRDSRAKFWG